MADYLFTLAPVLLEQELKKLIVHEADKADVLSAEALQDDEMLFGDASRIGLDSLDAV